MVALKAVQWVGLWGQHLAVEKVAKKVGQKAPLMAENLVYRKAG